MLHVALCNNSRTLTMSSSMVFFTLLVSLAVAMAGPAGGSKPVPTLPGDCPDFKPVATLDGSKFVGDWYLTHALKKGIEREENPNIKCVKHTNTIQPDGGFQSLITFTKDGKQGTKTITGSPIDGKITKLSIKKESGDEKKSKTLTVLAAEPNSYYATVICGSDGTNHGYLVQVFSHEKTLDAASLAKIKEALTGSNITDDLKAVEQC